MRTIKGPALFLAQFASDVAPFDDWHGITAWAASLGYEGVQVPSGDTRLFDLDLAVSSQDWRDEFLGIASANGNVPSGSLSLIVMTPVASSAVMPEMSAS